MSGVHVDVAGLLAGAGALEPVAEFIDTTMSGTGSARDGVDARLAPLRLTAALRRVDTAWAGKCDAFADSVGTYRDNLTCYAGSLTDVDDGNAARLPAPEWISQVPGPATNGTD